MGLYREESCALVSCTGNQCQHSAEIPTVMTFPHSELLNFAVWFFLPLCNVLFPRKHNFLKFLHICLQLLITSFLVIRLALKNYKPQHQCLKESFKCKLLGCARSLTSYASSLQCQDVKHLQLVVILSNKLGPGFSCLHRPRQMGKAKGGMQSISHIGLEWSSPGQC